MEKGSKTTSNKVTKSSNNVKKKKQEVEFKVLDINQKGKKSNITEEYIVAQNAKESIDNFKKVKQIIDKESNIARKKRAAKKKKINKRFRILAIILISILLIFIACIVLLLTLPIFNLQNVYITGTSRYDAALVADDLNLKVGENIFITMFKSNKDRIKNNYPYIESLRYNYNFPNSLELKVNERSQNYYAFNKEDSKYYILSTNGDILDVLHDTSSWTEEILVSGITFENKVILGEKINEIDLNKLNNFEIFKEMLGVNIEEIKITKVAFENEYMKIYINSSIEVIFESNKTIDDYNFVMLKLILEDVEGQNGIVDMTKEDPTFVKSN